MNRSASGARRDSDLIALSDAVASVADTTAHHPELFLQSLHGALQDAAVDRAMLAALEEGLGSRRWMERTLGARPTSRAHRITSQPGPIVAMSPAPDGSSLVCFSDSGVVCAFSTDSGRVMHSLVLPCRIRAAILHPERKRFAVIGHAHAKGARERDELWILDASSLQASSHLDHEAFGSRGLGAIAWTPDGDCLLCGLADGPKIELRHAPDWHLAETLEIRGSAVTAVCCAAQGEALYGGSPEGYVTRWTRGASGSFDDFSVSYRYQGPVAALTSTPASNVIALTSGTQVSLYDAGTDFSPRGSVDAGGLVSSVAFLGGANGLAVLSRSELSVWHFGESAPAPVARTTSRFTAMAVGGKPERLWTASAERQVDVWTHDGAEAARAVRVVCGAIGDGARCCAWGTEDGRVLVARVGSGSLLGESRSDSRCEQVASVALLGASASRVATTVFGAGTTICEPGGDVVCRIPKRVPGASCVTFLHGGELIALGGPRIEIFDAKSGDRLVVMQDRISGWVSSLRESHDGRHLFAAGTDSVLLAWELERVLDGARGGKVKLVVANNLDSTRLPSSAVTLRPALPASGLGTRLSRHGLSSDLFPTKGIAAFELDQRGDRAVILDQHRQDGHRIEDLRDSVTVWDVQNGSCLGELKSSRHGAVSAVGMAAGGELVTVGDRSGWVRLWRVRDLGTADTDVAPCGAIKLETIPLAIGFTETDRAVVVVGSEGAGVEPLVVLRLRGKGWVE